MRIYLDMCCFNRPYDDQLQPRIRIETEAKVLIQINIKNGLSDLIWSSILDYECEQNPFIEHKIAILNWRTIASTIIMVDKCILVRAIDLMTCGIREYDALHVASAIAGRAELFVTTDDRLLKRLRNIDGVVGMLPQDALAYMEHWYED